MGTATIIRRMAGTVAVRVAAKAIVVTVIMIVVMTAPGVRAVQ